MGKYLHADLSLGLHVRLQVTPWSHYSGTYVFPCLPRWQHIYLPLLPKSLVEYLSAPMPYLVGLPADLLTTIRHSNVPMSEVTLFDLDLHTVDPPPGSPGDDGRLLPYGRQLSAALQAVFKTLRSPTEYESSPVITGRCSWCFALRCCCPLQLLACLSSAASCCQLYRAFGLQAPCHPIVLECNRLCTALPSRRRDAGVLCAAVRLVPPFYPLG